MNNEQNDWRPLGLSMVTIIVVLVLAVYLRCLEVRIEKLEAASNRLALASCAALEAVTALQEFVVPGARVLTITNASGQAVWFNPGHVLLGARQAKQIVLVPQNAGKDTDGER